MGPTSPFILDPVCLLEYRASGFRESILSEEYLSINQPCPDRIEVIWLTALPPRSKLPFSFTSRSLNMAVLSSIVLGLLASVAVASPTPVQYSPDEIAQLVPRATIASDAVVGFAETVPSGTEGALYEAYQPYLYVVNGCVPFPAVNAAGDTR
jgi:hypothetical protein